jgi:hypothetical protein
MKKHLKKDEITHGHTCDEETVKYKKCVLKNVNFIFFKINVLK